MPQLLSPRAHDRAIRADLCELVGSAAHLHTAIATLARVADVVARHTRSVRRR